MEVEQVNGNSIIEQNRIKFGTENTKIKAVWLNNPQLTVKLNGGESNQKLEIIYTGGTVITIESPTKEGYIFKGWI